MYLVDTSAWIDFLRKKSDRLIPYIESRSVYLTEIVLFELLSGLPLERQGGLQRYLTLFEMLSLTDTISMNAAKVATKMRQKGALPQTTDMLIAGIALFHEATVIHRDRDFEIIKKFCPLQTISF